MCKWVWNGIHALLLFWMVTKLKWCWIFCGFFLSVFCSFWCCTWFLPPSTSKTFINFIYFTHDLWHLNESKPVASLHAYLIYSSRATKLTVFRSRCERTLKLHLQRNVCLLFISCTRTSPNDFRLSVSF